MATATGGTHVRVVRCPKCRQLLAEVANLPVYSCGGCGALLQAKTCKNEGKSIGSALHETDVATNELNHLSEVKEPRSLKNTANLSPDYIANHNKALTDLSNENQCSGGSHLESSELSSFKNEANPSPDYHNNAQYGVTDLSDENHYSGDSQLGSSELVHDENVESLPFAGAEAEEEAENDISAGRVVSSDDCVDGFLSESELSGMLRDMVKSSITVGSHAYDGSVSSFDGLEQDKTHMHPSGIAYKPDNLSLSGEKLIRRDQFLADSMRYIDPETKQHQPSKWMPESSDKKKLYAMKEKEWDCEELKEPARRHHQPRNWTELERKGVPLTPKAHRGPQDGNRTGRFSSQVHEEYRCDHSSQLQQQEQERMKLLRVIYELQNQLDKSYNLEGKAKGRVSVKEPTTHNHNVPDLKYPMHTGRSRLGSNSAQQFRFPRDRNDTDSRCLHCHPRDRQRSAPLPPDLHYKKEPPVIHHVHSCCNICSAVPSNTQQYMKPDLSTQVHESKSDDQRFKDHMMKKYAKGKHHVAKRHFRPKAGGAPFVTCYNCSKLLQLPEDFLILKRKCHRLSCGSCSTILKFSVHNRTRIIPYSPKAVEPPPSEVDECSGVMDRRSTALSSHGSNCPHTDLVSCSDDYGLSFCRSCISKGDHASLKPLHAIQDISDDREILYAKKEFIRKQIRNKHKDPMEAYGPGTSKTEFLSDSEVLQPRNGSQLHRLMGYPSPSVVIRGTGLPATGTRRF